jgi:hypothetical protein
MKLNDLLSQLRRAKSKKKFQVGLIMIKNENIWGEMQFGSSTQ